MKENLQKATFCISQTYLLKYFFLIQLTYEQIKQGLYKLFSVHGPIYEILIKTKDNGQHFAFIDYPDIKDTEKAWLAYTF